MSRISFQYGIINKTKIVIFLQIHYTKINTKFKENTNFRIYSIILQNSHYKLKINKSYLTKSIK